MIMSEQFEVELDYLKDREVEDDDEAIVKVEFSRENSIQAVWLTLDLSKKLAARLVEVNEELTTLRIMLLRRKKERDVRTNRTSSGRGHSDQEHADDPAD